MPAEKKYDFGDGRLMTLKQKCAETGIDPKAVQRRMYRYGLKAPEALETTLQRQTSGLMIEYHEREWTLHNLSLETGIHESTLRHAYQRGECMEEYIDSRLKKRIDPKRLREALKCGGAYRVEYQGKIYSIYALGRMLQIPESTLRHAYLHGECIETYVEQYLKKYPGGKKRMRKGAALAEYHGEAMTIQELSRRTGIPSAKLYKAWKRGDEMDRYVDAQLEMARARSGEERARRLLCRQYGFPAGSVEHMDDLGQGVYEYTGETLMYRVEIYGATGRITVFERRNPKKVWANREVEM